MLLRNSQNQCCVFACLTVIVVLIQVTIAEEEECKSQPCESCSQIYPVWPTGEQGERGAVGERGDRGIDGEVGLKGAVGDTGADGEVGPAGVVGAKGTKGSHGIPGEKGIQGVPGQATEREKGEIGVKGEKGLKGVPGFAGCPGLLGERGPTGPQGLVGEKGQLGPNGKTGADGEVGLRGRAGPQGQRGPMGRKGVVGPAGDKGLIGPVGDTGDVGDEGTPGVPGSVDTDVRGPGPRGRKGEKGGVNCSLDVADDDKNLPLYKGQKGKKGELGERGDYGLPGDHGLQGPPCNCSEANSTAIKAPRGVAGPHGPVPDRETLRGPTGETPDCTCPNACFEYPDVSIKPGDNRNKTKEISKTVPIPPGVAGLEGVKGDKGDVGVTGPGARGEKGARGPKGKGQCCAKPPEEKSYGRTPTIYVVHSQSINENVDCKDEQSELIWKGYSFLSADISRVATGQDLGRPGSCVQHFDPLPYSDCAAGMPCNLNQRSLQAIWLLAVDGQLNSSSQIPFSKLDKHVSRCAVCIAKSPVITLHRTTSCPVNTRQLWSGYSLAMFSSSMLSVSADLSHSGSCIQHFQTGLVIECDTSQNCRRYHDLRSHWLHKSRDENPGQQKNCVVCVDDRSNDFERNLPRPRIYAEHYQSPVAPLNPCSSAPGVFPILANGYSLLHLEDTRAVVQDLGTAGSCMPRFSPVPFLTCPTFGSCYAKERQTKASWLSGLHASGKPGTAINLATSPSVLSRCSICISDAPVLTIHSQNTTVPSCPRSAGRWMSLWTGYSFLGHFSNAAGGQQHLDSPGSCLREFMSPVYFECAGATGECRFQSDQHDFWLTASNADSIQRNARQSILADRTAATSNLISRCVVCKLVINN